MGDETYPHLSVNINHECADVLRRVMQDRGISATEAVRRAIWLLAFTENAKREQTVIYIREQDGSTFELLTL